METIKTDEFQYIPTDKVSDRIKLFALKKHEITMAALNEIEKLKNQLLFVSMQDYNKVVHENAELRKQVNQLKALQKREYVNLSNASKLTGLAVDTLLEKLSEAQVATRVSGKYIYYQTKDLLAKIK